jgi:hypothetical protein
MKPRLWKRNGLWGGVLSNPIVGRYVRVEGKTTAWSAYAYLKFIENTWITYYQQR